MSILKTCQNCSRCCASEKIRLTPRDVFAISYQKQIDIETFLKEFCDINMEKALPIITLKEKEYGCVFKNKNTCKLIRKPDACAVFPYGNQIWFGEEECKITVECQLLPGMPMPTYSPSDTFDLPTYEEDPFWFKWEQATAVLEMLISGIAKESDRLEASETALFYLYKNYTFKKSFASQFDKNVLTIVSQIS